MADELRIALKITERGGIARQQWPFTRGIPLPQGTSRDAADLWLENGRGEPIPAQFRTLGRWPDDSARWVLVDFQTDVEPGAETTCWLRGGGPQPIEHPHPLRIDERDERIEVCTGSLRFSVRRDTFGLLASAALGHRNETGEFAVDHQLTPSAGADTRARICESWSDGQTSRRIYGMGGDCLARLAPDEFAVSVEESGPLRAVICCRGAYEADIPVHHYAGYRPLRFVTRLHVYAGHPFVRVLHTIIFTGNPRETEIEEIGLRLPISLSGQQRYRTALRRPVETELQPGDYWLLSQRRDDHAVLQRQASGRIRQVAESARAPGWLAVEDDAAGVGVALRHMAEEYPKALGLGSAGIDIFPWRDPQGQRLSFRRYAEEVAWHQGEGVYSDGTGSAKTSEFFVHFYRATETDAAIQQLAGLLDQPGVATDPAWTARCAATGGFSPRDPDRFPASERMLAGFVEWLERNMEIGRWYGFLDWGDTLCAWDQEQDTWRYQGRWGWNNSEWDPRHGVWIQYLRTGQDSHFRLGEAMTRHSVDVDTCHFHPFRPYMVGGCFRHSVGHFGDEPCASHTFLDNWMDYYYLTGDQRTLEVIREAGEFLLRYRWTENPSYSFSLRSIANALRGLLYACEATGEERFMRRAEEVYAVIARGQNEDGSWNKRFQVSTPDRLPDQAPYGMATEGTTLAVEMGTAAPFTEAEFRPLRGPGTRQLQVMPDTDHKGYQTHYLMIGLELMHRMTGREDVRAAYLKAVDWFCGNSCTAGDPSCAAGDDEWDASFAWSQNYHGIICRHLGYAHQLSGDRRYLEIGRQVLRRLIDGQDWSDDPRRRGAVAMTPMAISLLFFGVPHLLGQLREAGMDESP